MGTFLNILFIYIRHAKTKKKCRYLNIIFYSQERTFSCDEPHRNRCRHLKTLEMTF